MCKEYFHRNVFGYRTNGHTRSYCPGCSLQYQSNWERKNQRTRKEWDTSEPGAGKASARKCKTCKKEFWPNLCNVKRGGGIYCCLACSSEGQKRKQPVLKCKQCGGEFSTKTSEVKRGAKFCSAKCGHLYNSGENNPFWREHYTSYRGRGWRKIREIVLDRDGYKCVSCGKTDEDEKRDLRRSLSIHHIKPYRNGEDNSLENLETLCASCHRKAESAADRRARSEKN